MINKIKVFFLMIYTLCLGITPINAQKIDKKYSSSSNKAIKNFENAQISFDARKDDEAVELLQKAIKIDANFIEARMFLAEVYGENKKYKEALEEAKTATSISPDFFKSAYYSMGFWALKLQLYDESEKNFNHFLAYKGISAEAKSNATLGLKSAQFARVAIKNPVSFNPLNMGKQVNSDENDYLPAITADEQTLVYTRLIPKDPNGSQTDMRNKSEDFYSCKNIKNYIKRLNSKHYFWKTNIIFCHFFR
jgi:tetratricopeptide (TPR) repeat protein